MDTCGPHATPEHPGRSRAYVVGGVAIGMHLEVHQAGYSVRGSSSSLGHAIGRKHHGVVESVSQLHSERREETARGIADHANAQIPPWDDVAWLRSQDSMMDGGRSIVPEFSC